MRRSELRYRCQPASYSLRANQKPLANEARAFINASSALLPKPSARVKAFDWSIRATRSEEHTSELQSRLHLVCRLLLEKKKIQDSNSFCKNTPHPA